LQTEPLLYEAYIVTGQVYTVFRNFPLDFHANAVPAAKAAWCAGQQDPKHFWAMHDWLFLNLETWQSASDATVQFRSQVVSLGADGAVFDACLQDAKSQAAIDKDLADGQKLGVRGTPAFFLYPVDSAGNLGTPKPLSGALPFQQFSQAIDDLLAGQ
jgi:protein-disulfide isomerase